MASVPEARRFRLDIQALRAVAIIGVFVNHLRPGWLPGGFLGVDVFFVISGFLISSHLMRDAERGRLNLVQFWLKRVRRLAPAALTALAATAVATFLLVDGERHEQFMSEILSSLLLTENWHLALNSQDYFGQIAASPVRHFWSLGVEEQFYIVFPMLVGVVWLLCRWLKMRLYARRGLLIAVAVISVLSFLYMIRFTQTAPEWTFYATHARLWEFGCGIVVAGLVGGRDSSAWAVRDGHPVRRVTAVVSVALLVVSFVWFAPGAVRPGFATILPALAAAALIWAGEPANLWAFGALVRARWVQFVGDASYSIYLWHWPLIVLLPYAWGSMRGLRGVLVVVALTPIIAGASRRLIEVPFMRSRSPWVARPTLALASFGTAAVVMGLGVFYAGTYLRQPSADSFTAAAVHIEQSDKCVGGYARAHASECEIDLDAPAVTAFEGSQNFTNYFIKSRYMDCGMATEATQRTPGDCTYVGGNGTGRRVAILGDSHSYFFTPEIFGLASDQNWRVFSLAHSSCPWSDTGIDFEPLEEGVTFPEERIKSCDEWIVRTKKFLADSNIDVAFVTQMNAREWGDTSLAGITSALSWLADTVPEVVVVRDVPLLDETSGTCATASLAGHGSMADCGLPREEALFPDLLVAAAESLGNPSVHILDLSDAFCDETFCFAGGYGEQTYFDSQHVSASWSVSLGPLVEERLPADLTGGG